MKAENSNKTEEERMAACSDLVRDKAELANSPIPGKIPGWWLIEGTPEQVAEWLRQLQAQEATLE